MPLWYEDHWQALLLLQAMLGVFVFSYSLRRRRHFALRLAAGMAVGMAVVEKVTELLFDYGMVAEFSVITVLYLILCLIVWLCYEESVWTVLFVTASGYALQDMASGIKAMLRYTLPVDLFRDLSATTPGVLLVDLLCYGGVYLAGYLIFRAYTKNGQDGLENKYKAIFAVIVLLLCAGLTRLTRDGMVHSLSLSVGIYLYRLLSDSLILIVQYSVMERALLAGRVEAMQEIVHRQHSQYQASKDRVWQINEKYHDLKQLLAQFRGKVPDNQVDALEKSISTYEDVIHTGSDVLDVVLGEKREQCRRRDIQLTCYADGAGLAFADPLDLYSLLGDALDNAIRAAERMPEGQRFITFTARQEGGMAAIHIENPAPAVVEMEGGLPRDPRDRACAGFGMRSMQRTAAKYGGSLAVKQKNGMFYLDVLLFDPGPVRQKACL